MSWACWDASIERGVMSNDPVSGTLKVLIVDDHEVSRRFTLEALRQNGVSVKQTGSAGAAYLLALDWRPDVMFVDVQLREHCGLDLVERLLRHWPDSERPPRVVIMSALSDPGRVDSRIGTLTHKVLEKPLSTRDILEAIRRDSYPGAVAETEHPSPELQRLFRQELRKRIPELESALSSLDLTTSRTILHQLIASSAICRQRKMESQMRELDLACQNGDLKRIAHPWFELVRLAGSHLVQHQ